MGAGCGVQRASDEGAVDAPGILVFSGLSTPPYLHSVRPDGTDEHGVALPKTCSPQKFSADTLVCWNLDGSDLERNWQYAVGPKGGEWRVVDMPLMALPDWAGLDQYQVAAAQWSPSRDRIAFVRILDDDSTYGWFSPGGDVSVAAPEDRVRAS